MVKKYHLRVLEIKDAKRMLEWMYDDEVMRYFQFDGKSKTIEDILKFIELSFDETYNIQRAIAYEDGLYCGTVSLKNIDKEQAAEVAIVVHPDAIGTGAGTQAIREILKVAFNLKKLNRVYLNVLENNERAIHVYEKQGFRYKKSTKTSVRDKDVWLKWYEITRDEYVRRQSMSGVRLIEFQQKGDERGHLVVIEGLKDIPFSIARAFYIYGSDKDIIRGRHANRKSEFVLVNVAGTSKVKVDDGHGNMEVFDLNRPHIGIYLPKMIWKDMYEFSEDSVLLCLSSEPYDNAEYIRDYDEYVKEINK